MTIELLWSYLKYDCDQLMHRYANVRKQDDPIVREYADMSGSDTSDEDLIRRLVVTGTAQLRKKLRDYLTKCTEDADDTLPTSKTSWSFTFNSDTEFDGHGMAELMHWFVVRFAMWQWCKTFAPDEASQEKSELDDLEEDLDRILDDASMPAKTRTAEPDYNEAEITITYTSES